MPECDLVICVPSLGVLSETFIRRHCSHLAPGRVRFLTFSVDQDDPAWPPEVVTRLPSKDAPIPSRLARLVARTQPRDRRRAQREVWWMGEESVGVAVGALHALKPRAILLEYLDRWLDLLPHLESMDARTVVHGHGYDLSASLLDRRTVDAYRQHLVRADVTVVPSEYARRRLQAVGVTNVQVNAYGVEPMAADHTRRPRTPGERPLRVVAVGRLVPKKNPGGLVASIRGAVDAGADVHLDLYGDGPLRAEVRREIHRFDLTDRITMHGPTPHTDIRRALSAADVFAQHSVRAAGGDEEGLPLAILEAMSAGLPVVSTVHAGIPEAVVDDETGILVAEHDVARFADALVRYERSPDLALEHGTAGLARFERSFTASRHLERLRTMLGLTPD